MKGTVFHMKPFTRNIFSAALVIALAAAVIAGCGGGEKARTDVKVTVAFISGPVESQAGGAGEWKKVSQNAEITMADAIRTGEKAFAKLNFPDGSKVFLDEKTSLNLKEVKMPGTEKSTLDIVLEVITGSIFCDVTKRENSKFEVETSTAVAGVKGTRFVVSQNAQGGGIAAGNAGSGAQQNAGPAGRGQVTVVIVTEGKVEVKNKDGETITLESEEIAEVQKEQKKSKKEKLDLAKAKFAGIPLMKTLSPEDITQRIQVLQLNK